MGNQEFIDLEGDLMSNLLINEPPLQVLPSLAAAIGLNEALLLQQLHYWLRHAKVEHEGKMWIYKTYESWHEQDFKFWSVRTIKRIVNHLIDLNLLLVKRLSSNSFNRVNHYTINYIELAIITKEHAVSIAVVDSDRLAQSKMPSSHQHSDTLAQSDSDRLAQSLREQEETNKENIHISGNEKNDDVISVMNKNAQSILDWQAPSKETMQAELVRAGSILNMTDDQYQIYVDDFKGHFEQNALTGKPLLGDRNRKNRLRQWLENKAKKQSKKSNIFQGTNNGSHQSSNSQPSHFDNLRAEAAAKYGRSNNEPRTVSDVT